MRADICDPDDEVAIERFKSVLKQLGGKTVGKSWGIGVDVFDLQVGEAVITIFSDAWSIDIEGPENLVHEALHLLSQKSSSPTNA